MPWKECHVMDERLRFVARLLDGEKMAAVCADFGISRKIGYKILDMSHLRSFIRNESEVTLGERTARSRFEIPLERARGLRRGEFHRYDYRPGTVRHGAAARAVIVPVETFTHVVREPPRGDRGHSLRMM